MPQLLFEGFLLSPPIVMLSLNLLLLWQVVFGRIDKFLIIKHTYAVNTLFMPAYGLLAGLAGVLAVGRFGAQPWRLPLALAWLAGALALLGARFYATHFEPRRLALRRVQLRSPKVAAPLRILHVSDIQTHGIGRHERRVFELMRRLAPDLIVHTGDLIQPIAPATLTSERRTMAPMWRALAPPLGKLAVVGDFDRWMHEYLPEPLPTLRVLHHEEAVFETPAGRLRVYGLPFEASCGEDPGLRPRVLAWQGSAEPGDLTLLLGHRPDYVLDLLDVPIDLCLAGHTHGGQVRLPGWGALMTESRVPRRWARVLHRAGQTLLNVSAGIGCEQVHEIPALRVFCPPEMTLIEFLPEPALSPVAAATPESAPAAVTSAAATSAELGARS